mmetsp:Transcript_106775/g.278793  ORF Transcript_106775/g.278793 Transcript_106775/m.278793 type:complete len:232 (+) Transcript_106775:220-915(+)
MDHVEYLVFYVVDRSDVNLLGLQLIHDGPEEISDDEAVNYTIVVDVYQLPKIMDRLTTVLVVHGEHEIKERLVVHLPFASFRIPIRVVLLEDPLYENVSEHVNTTAVVHELCLTQHSVLIRIQLQVGAVNLQGRLDAEPVGLRLLGAEGSLLPQLVELLNDQRGKQLADVDLACPLGVQEEKEPPDGREHVEGVELLLQRVQLGQSRDEFEYEVFHVFLPQVPEAYIVVVT